MKSTVIFLSLVLVLVIFASPKFAQDRPIFAVILAEDFSSFLALQDALVVPACLAWPVDCFDAPATRVS